MQTAAVVAVKLLLQPRSWVKQPHTLLSSVRLVVVRLVLTAWSLMVAEQAAMAVMAAAVPAVQAMPDTAAVVEIAFTSRLTILLGRLAVMDGVAVEAAVQVVAGVVLLLAIALIITHKAVTVAPVFLGQLLGSTSVAVMVVLRSLIATLKVKSQMLAVVLQVLGSRHLVAMVEVV
jgi:hypothetical protein